MTILSKEILKLVRWLCVLQKISKKIQYNCSCLVKIKNCSCLVKIKNWILVKIKNWI